MSLQFVRHCIGTRAAKVAGFLLAAWMVTAGAGAQVATRTHLSINQAGAGATFTAQVADVAGDPAMDGTVSFETAKGSLGSAFVKNGTATLTTDKLPQGTRTVTAAYSGSAVLETSSAAASAAEAASTLPDFALTADPTALSLNPGQSGNVTVTVTPENGFNDMVTLSCSGVPATSQCIFSPATITPLTASAVTSTLQIVTQAASGKSATLTKSTSAIAFAIALPGAFALLGLGAFRKRPGIAALRVGGLLAILIASGLAMSGCSERYGYLNHPPSGNPGTFPGTYTITVSGYASLSGTSVVGHSLNVTLTVK
ncbi:MAG TPA: Ig-like domain-containing protein [Silvibacterium sp.]|nr:Ig-like domain-containing protein [Silvibacterium sp.]